MNHFENKLVDFFGKRRLEKLQNIRIGIAGAGGLGSNCAFNLVRSGFKHFVLIDFDLIDYSNLNRQFYFYNQVGQPKVDILRKNLLDINPDLNIRIFKNKITEDNLDSIFADCQVIIEALDNVCGKKLIVERFLNDSRLLVAASGLAGWGKSDQIRTKKINKNSYIVGDFTTEVSLQSPPFSPRVNIAAAKQADVVFNHILEVDKERNVQ